MFERGKDKKVAMAFLLLVTTGYYRLLVRIVFPGMTEHTSTGGSRLCI